MTFAERRRRWVCVTSPMPMGSAAPVSITVTTTARELAQGETLAKALKERGIPCYMDAVGD